MTTTLIVHGQPAPQGSKSAYPRMGKDGKMHVAMVEGKGPGREKFISWRQAVATAARDSLDADPRPALDEPVKVDIEFRFPRPAGDRYVSFKSTKPDADKLARSVLDSLVDGGILVDDSRVYDLHVRKLYGPEPGATIRIEPQGHVEDRNRDLLKAEAKYLRSGPKAG